jgi:hypothetical protein
MKGRSLKDLNTPGRKVGLTEMCSVSMEVCKVGRGIEMFGFDISFHLLYFIYLCIYF